LIFFISFTATVICPIYAANNLWVGPPGGLWSNPFNWSGGVPGPTDTVQIITAGDNVNLDVVAPIIQDLEITADADLTAGGIRLITVSGYVTVTTTGTYDDANIFIRMTGVGTINASQTLGPLEVDPGAGNTVTIMTNNLDLSSTLDITTGTLDTGIQNLTVASTCTINGILDFSGAGGNILTLNGTLDCNGTLDASGNGNITSTGNVDFTVGNFSKGTGTFTFSSGGAQTLISALEDLGNIQVSAAFTNLILNDAANFDAVTVNFGTTLDASVAGSDITVQGDWSNTGVFSCGTNMVTFSGPNDPQTLASGGDNFYDET
jgi:hypothetical protein